MSKYLYHGDSMNTINSSKDAGSVEYDNTKSGLEATNVQDAIDEISSSSFNYLRGINGTYKINTSISITWGGSLFKIMSSPALENKTITVEKVTYNTWGSTETATITRIDRDFPYIVFVSLQDLRSYSGYNAYVTFTVSD